MHSKRQNLAASPGTDGQGGKKQRRDGLIDKVGRGDANQSLLARELLDLSGMYATTSKIWRLLCGGLLAAASAAASAVAPEYQAPEQIEAAARAEAQRRLPALAANQQLLSGPVDGRLQLVNCPRALSARVPAGAMLRDRAMVAWGSPPREHR